MSTLMCKIKRLPCYCYSLKLMPLKPNAVLSLVSLLFDIPLNFGSKKISITLKKKKKKSAGKAYVSYEQQNHYA